MNKAGKYFGEVCGGVYDPQTSNIFVILQNGYWIGIDLESLYETPSTRELFTTGDLSTDTIIDDYITTLHLPNLNRVVNRALTKLQSLNPNNFSSRFMPILGSVAYLYLLEHREEATKAIDGWKSKQRKSK